MKEVLGKCPKCGALFLKGQYGPYCADRCGFRVGKIFGEELSDAEVKKLLSGRELLLRRISKKTGKEYAVLVELSDVKEYPFTRKDGTSGVGFYPEVTFRFPNYEEMAAYEERNGSETNENPDDGFAAVIGAEELPF